MDIDISESEFEFLSVFKSYCSKDTTERVFEDIIRSCRQMELDYRNGDAKFNGIGYIDEMLKNGYIKMELYLQLRKCVENPEQPYNIIVS